MATTRKTRGVYLSAEAEKVLQDRTCKQRGVSPTISQILERYAAMMDAAHQGFHLTADEWHMIAIAYADSEYIYQANGACMLLAIEDAFGDDHPLTKMIAAMSRQQRAAVADAIERYWIAEPGYQFDLPDRTAQILTDIGIVIHSEVV